MKQVRLTDKQLEDLNIRGYTFTARSYYWKCYDGNIVCRITKDEFMRRSITEPFQNIELVRVYRRGGNVQD